MAAAGFDYCQKALDETAAARGLRAEGQFTPDHGVTQRAFGGIVGWFDAFDVLAEGRLIQDANELPWLLAIEAKIDAEEGEEQLALYDDWLERHAGSRDVIRVFLTPDGRASETGEAEWKPLSFVDLASVFRRVRDLQDKPGYHFLRYYLAGLLRDVCALPVPLSAECRNPYTAADYLKSVLGPAVEESVDDASR